MSNRLKWSNAKPEKPGVWFWRDAPKCPVYVVNVYQHGPTLWANGGEAGIGCIKDWSGQFAGPIEEPEE